MPQNTKLKYLENPKSYKDTATVLDLQKKDGDDQYILLLDQTIFYPQGSGQPCDNGLVVTKTKSFAFRVKKVQSTDGVVQHIGNIEKGSISIGREVEMVVNKNKRLYNSKIHSAGELICSAMIELGYKDWRVVRAIHYPNRSSVTFNHSISKKMAQKLKDVLENKVNQMISNGNTVTTQTVTDREEVEKLCGFEPDYIPKGQPVRIVTVFGGLGRPCMGTHVNDIKEIGNVEIKKVKSKKGITKISYAVPKS